MAQLRYQSVAAPNLSGISQILANSSSGFSAGFDKLSNLLNERANDRATAQSNAIIPELAQVGSEAEVNQFLQGLGGKIDPRNMSPELLSAITNLRKNAQGFDQGRLDQSKTRADIRGVDARTRGTQAQTQIALNADGRTQTQFDRGIAREDALAGHTNHFANARIGAYRGQNDLGGLAPSTLIQTESGGNFAASNDATGSSGRKGHFGRVQFGKDRLDDAKRAGAIPKDMTPEQFLKDPDAQVNAEKWHFGDIQQNIDKAGLTKYIGQNVNGTPITRDGIVAMAHLGGFAGAKKFLESGGKYNPADSNGTTLSAYAKTHAGNTSGNVPYDYSSGGVLRPQDINPLIDETYKAFGIGQDRRNTDAVNADANRARDTAFNNAQTASNTASAGLAAAIERANTSLNPTEAVQSIASDPNLTPEEKQAALGSLGNLPVDTIQAPRPGSQPASFPETGQANVIIDSFVKEQQAALANNDNIRINKNAAEAYSDGSPANKLLERIPGLNANNATVLTAINKVREALPAGASPALAASLIEETVRQGRSFIPFDGEDSSTVEIDTDAAIAKGRQILSPEGVRGAAEITAQAENNKAGLDQIQQAISGLQTQITREEQLGRDSSASRELLKNYNDRLLTFQRDNPVVGQTNRAVEQTAAPQGQQVPVSQNPAEREAAVTYLRSQPELVQQLQNWGSYNEAQKAAIIQQATQHVLSERLMTTNQKRAVIGELNALRAGN